MNSSVLACRSDPSRIDMKWDKNYEQKEQFLSTHSPSYMEQKYSLPTFMSSRNGKEREIGLPVNFIHFLSHIPIMFVSFPKHHVFYGIRKSADTAQAMEITESLLYIIYIKHLMHLNLVIFCTVNYPKLNLLHRNCKTNNF